VVEVVGVRVEARVGGAVRGGNLSCGDALT
jgi:hypothetical protein